MSAIAIITADLERPDHQQSVIELLDAYSQDPAGDGKPLADEVRRNLISGLQQHPTTHILLAYIGERPVGLAICFLGFSTFAAKPLLNLHDFAVLAEYRGQGLGRQLMAAVVAKAQELGCCKVTLEVDEHNQRAREVYRQAGFGQTERVERYGQGLFMTKPI